MNYLKKTAASAMALLLAGSLGACSIGGDTNWVAKFGDQTVPAGVYLIQMVEGYYGLLDESGVEDDALLKTQFDGQSGSQKVSDNARAALNAYIAVEEKFDELGLTPEPLAFEAIPQNAEMYWQYVGQVYERNGVSIDSYTKTLENTTKKSQVFNAIYGEGGSQEVPESEIRAKFETDYAKIIVIPLSFSGSEDEETKKEADQNTRDTINGYKQRADAGEDMEDLVYEARKQAPGDEDLEKPEAGSSYTFVNRNNSQYGQPVTDAIFAAANGVPTVFEDENSIFLFTRYDITENENDFTSRKASILAEMKAEEFDALIAEWATALSDVTYNEAAFKRYSAEKLKLS